MNGDKKVDILAGSHIPVLAILMDVTRFSNPGGVLELGAGWNSTPFLYWMCKAQDRYLESYENDREWIKKLEYPVRYTEDWQVGMTKFWDIVLVDHKPARKRRSSALRFRLNARFVVLHDSELADHPAYKYTPIYKEFRYKYEYTKVLPHTMVLSNFDDPRVYFP